MKNETFAETLKEALEHYDHKEIVFDKYVLKIHENILYCFEVYGDFLNCIPAYDREQIIYNDILVWINKYTSNSMLKEINRLIPIEKEAPKEIKKNIGIIEKFENMLIDNFSPLEESIKLNNEFNIPNDPQRVKTIEAIKIMLKTTNSLKDDLENKDFKIFPKHKYCAYDKVPKKELTTILDNLIKKYRIKNHSPHKKQLIDNIITL